MLLKGADLQLFLALKDLLKERGLQPSVTAAFYEESFEEEILVGEFVPENLLHKFSIMVMMMERYANSKIIGTRGERIMRTLKRRTMKRR